MLDKLRTLFPRRIRPRTAPRAVEYGLLIAGIAALIVVAVFALGPILQEAFDDTCDTIGANDNNAATGDCAS